MTWEQLAKHLMQIERAHTLSQKELLLQAIKDDKLVREIFEYTYSNNKKYYLTSPVPEDYESTSPIPTSAIDKAWEEYKKLLDLLDKQRSRTLETQVKVKQFLQKIPQPYLKWWVRVMNRDLRLGIGEVGIRKYFPHVLPEVEVMKAYLVTQVRKLPPQVYIEPKYDGVRLLVLVDKDGSIQVYTRNGRRQEALEDVLEQCHLSEGVYDTEGFTKDWNTTMHLLAKDPSKLILYVFDFIPRADYERYKGTKIPLRQRKVLLTQHLTRLRCRNVRPAESRLISSEDVNKYYEYYVNKGYEGAMIKDPESPYIPTRSTYWLKLKDRDVDVYRVIEVLPGTGKYQNALGALVVRAKDGTTFKVGSGFTDEQRIQFWKNKNDILGKCVEVALFTSPQKVSKASFPTFVRLRPDVSSCG
jgi:DNA ligase-1